MASVVVYTLAKDEVYIAQWIYHYIKHFNVDHVFIYDDRSAQPLENHAQVLSSDMQRRTTVRRVTTSFFDTDAFKATEYYDEVLYTPDKSMQLYFMELFIRRELPKLITDNTWVFFLDCDEFLYCLDPDGAAGIRRLLNNSDEDAIYVPWLMYNTSLRVDAPVSGPLLLNYTYHARNYHTVGKSIARGSSLLRAVGRSAVECPHILFRSWRSRSLGNEGHAEFLHLAHYHTMSVKQFIRRKLLDMSIGHANLARPMIRNPNYVLYTLLTSFEASSNGHMAKYCDGELIDFTGEPSEVPSLDDHFPFALATSSGILSVEEVAGMSADDKIETCDGRPIDLGARHLFERLVELLDDPHVRYCRRDEVMPSDFRADIYRGIYPDLTRLTDLELDIHYLLKGRCEGRFYKITVPVDFDAVTYRRLNPDLAELTDIQVAAHYIAHGKREGRSYLPAQLTN